MTLHIKIRAFEPCDALPIQKLFIRAHLSIVVPPSLSELSHTYVSAAVNEEIGKIADYYKYRGGEFWVALIDQSIVGMFGLVPSHHSKAVELRRVSVDPEFRRKGIARAMLVFAEQLCIEKGLLKIELSTSAFQKEAISLYSTSGYELEREVILDLAGRKVSTFYFSKVLAANL